MCSIPDGTYEIKIGETFLRGDKNNKSSKAEFNTLRFDFKPASITDGSEAFLAISSGENNGVQVIVPGETKKSTIFHGSKKPLKGDKECLLIFDQNTCQLRLEKLSANINVKKSRDAKLSNDVEEQIEKMMKLKAPPPSPIKIKEEIKKERLFSTSSNSMNEEEEEDDDEDMFDVDEEASALEQMMVFFLKFYFRKLGGEGLDKWKVGRRHGEILGGRAFYFDIPNEKFFVHLFFIGRGGPLATSLNIKAFF
uniref:Ell-associated factor Eaf n=1 Tax=Meloidogyne incognita TaxID=6306 RepID=A0A914L4Q7_MELIC